MNADDAMGFHPLARAFHWIVAVLVFAVWPLGAVISFIAEEHKTGFYFWHESLGFLVLWLMLARLCVRFLTVTPAKPDMPAPLVALAHANQWALYLALIVQPVIGFLMTNAHGFPLDWFGLFTVPSPIGKSPEIADILSAVHYWLALTILGLVVLHVAGALFHRVIRRDDTLARMT